VKNSPLLSEKPIAWILAAAALLYLALFPLYYVGYFVDDAVYILGAQSLWQGHYSAPYLLDAPPITRLPPGFPVFLMPFVQLVQPHWVLLKIIPFLLTLGSIYLFWRVIQPWMSSRSALLLTGLYAFNPVVAIFSGSVMAEGLSALLMLSSLIVLRGAAKRSSWNTPWWLAGLLGWSALTRVLGGLIIPSVGLALWKTQRKRLAVVCTLLSLIPFGLFALRNLRLSGHSSEYLPLWKHQLDYLARHPALLFDNSHRMLHTLVVMGLYGQQWAYSAISILVGGVLIGGSIAAVLYGYSVVWRDHPEDRAVLGAIGCFSLAYTAVILNWTFVDGRFAIPLIPWMTVFLGMGMQHWLSRYALHARFLRWGLTIWIVSLAWGNKALLEAAYHPTGSLRMPAATFAWIKQHVPEDRPILNALPPVYLYTGRRGVAMLKILDPDEWRLALLQKNVGYFYYRHPPQLDLQIGPYSSDRMYARALRWVLQAPDAFIPVYINTDEKTVLYQVLPDPGFEQAMVFYHQGLQLAESGETTAALAAFEASLHRSPRVACVLSAYGGLQLNAGNLNEARRALTKALEIQPDQPYALYNRAMLYEKEKQEKQALELLLQALKRIPEDEYPDVVHDIRSLLVAQRLYRGE
jgi:tetratricopeptide (TPR) repeat protein